MKFYIKMILAVVASTILGMIVGKFTHNPWLASFVAGISSFSLTIKILIDEGL